MKAFRAKISMYIDYDHTTQVVGMETIIHDHIYRYGDHPAYLRVASEDRLLPVFYIYDSYR